MKSKVILLFTLLLIFFTNTIESQNNLKEGVKPSADSIQKIFQTKAKVLSKIKLESISLVKNNLSVIYSSGLSEYPILQEDILKIRNIIRYYLPAEYKDYKIAVYSGEYLLNDLIIPTEFSNTKPKREFKKEKTLIEREKYPIVKSIQKKIEFNKGLSGKNLAIWQSHGRYYEQKLLRWEWQRARIFQTVEDLYTQSYVLPYLVPMLENSGATVFLPRERDTQLNEIIVDNDNPKSGFKTENGKNLWGSSIISGFSNPKEVYTQGENPFKMGTAQSVIVTSKEDISFAEWKPNFPETGEYAIYISYLSFPNSSTKAQYTVYHAGGISEFHVNQQMGGGTWVYLGKFYFKKGTGEDGRVLLSNASDEKNRIVTADAIKFGGGFGNIARSPSQGEVLTNRPSSSQEEVKKVEIFSDVEPSTSGYPRFTEGARYWLQWAGMNDTIYSPNNGLNDYNDDYMSRGRWVNALSGGSSVNPKVEGYKIPINLAFAFHTDAGTTKDSSLVGTLGIYTTLSENKRSYPNGENRILGRYLADIIQSQIVNDLKSNYTSNWPRRGLWDKSYSESRTPNIPTMLLELLSHQNFADMQYGLDPNFRFTVSRSIYKGMLKFLAKKYNFEYQVQPLPVKSIYSKLKGDTLEISWRPVDDPLESTATAEKYIVYTKVGNGFFDAGTIVKKNSFKKTLSKDLMYSFKVTACNSGGESFPSEEISAYKSSLEEGKVLIINGFTRISGPLSYGINDSIRAGFDNRLDPGVAYKKDIAFTGEQYEFRREIPWMDDDSPGFGSSRSNYEGTVLAGNTFNYAEVHGEAFALNNYTFVSSSREAFESGEYKKEEYDLIDIIMGNQLSIKQKNSIIFPVFTDRLLDNIKHHTANGGGILISGSNIATDIWDNLDNNDTVIKNIKEIFKYQWRTNQASITGVVNTSPTKFKLEGTYIFSTQYNKNIYPVASPDGIEPLGDNATTIFRYADTNISAGTAYVGDYTVVALGFPIESIDSQKGINDLINNLLKIYKSK